MSSTPFRGIAVLPFVLSIGFALSPALAPDFGGFAADQFPIPQEDPSVQPEGYAFAIWAPIFLWLIVGTGYCAFKRSDSASFTAMRLPLNLSLAVGIVWLPVAVISPVWATILIWAMLIPALAAVFASPRADYVWASWPIGLYAGWLSAASCVALGLIAAGYGWMSEDTAAWVFVGLAICIGFGVQWRLGHAPTYGIAVIWALIAVAVRNDFALDSVAVLALLGCGALIWPTLRAFR